MQVLSRNPTEFFSNAEVWHVRPDRIEQVFRVCVTAPELPIPDGSLVGAIYSTDGDLSAGSYASATRVMAIGGELPQLYSIAIGYPIGHQPWHLLQRARELAPTPRPEWDHVLPTIFGSEDIVPSGGGDEFLDFIVSELRPALADAYPIDPQDATLCGASLGGLFVARAFARAPESFRRYLMISPNLSWDQGVVLRQIQDLVASRSAPSVSVAYCVGELERHHAEAIDALLNAPDSVRDLLRAELATIDMEGHMHDFEKATARWAGNGFRLFTRVLPGESHHSEGGAALSWGLRSLFGPDAGREEGRAS